MLREQGVSFMLLTHHNVTVTVSGSQSNENIATLNMAKHFVEQIGFKPVIERGCQSMTVCLSVCISLCVSVCRSVCGVNRQRLTRMQSCCRHVMSAVVSSGSVQCRQVLTAQ